MIQMRTILDVADNSGARQDLHASCPWAGPPAATPGLGDIITANVKESAPDAPEPVRKGKVVKAVIVRCAKEQRRRDGSYIRFDQNAAVLINEDGRAGGHARVRPGGARAARQEVHEDHLAGAGGPLGHGASRRSGAMRIRITQERHSCR